ncbi:DNA-binding transcriptional regulator, AcrR family [Amycolatopsis arida]|uniref:DNA-binding transcriptional regulator, AcrR family n=1 Tax=Amycolatopsis arida TaxID=587909 RepID=A0A1I5VNZ5_9PSEU|nr:TetR/AcrR family transcriptional regulator [Amycolatopsis arida]TDX87975.1 AcrR family transcriptional regulator [Amycolatopsis arida]SFQ09284.1 DNA-binding transcriptional regulator, AcrR family [Amycolatopsis arida]
MGTRTARKRQAGGTASGRRAELLALAARLFAERGYVSTTVRDIADAAGILSGSLYHHFDSKESMADEILRGFLDELFGTYAEIVAAGLGPRRTLEAVVTASFRSIHDHPAEVAIYQNEAKHLAQFDRFDYLERRNAEFRRLWNTILTDGVRDGVFRADLDVELVYRFIRDTVWVAVRWYNPGGTLSADDVAKQYLAILLDGIATGSRST